jgi:hypothetical protein
LLHASTVRSAICSVKLGWRMRLLHPDEDQLPLQNVQNGGKLRVAQQLGRPRIRPHHRDIRIASGENATVYIALIKSFNGAQKGKRIVKTPAWL